MCLLDQLFMSLYNEVKYNNKIDIFCVPVDDFYLEGRCITNADNCFRFSEPLKTN